jgi:hypothetical protein
MTDIGSFYVPPPRAFKLGWQLDFYGHLSLPRLVYRKQGHGSDSTCFVYLRTDLKDHFRNKCLTNLEYLEGEEFFNAVGLPALRETALIAMLPKDEYRVEGAKIVVTND